MKTVALFNIKGGVGKTAGSVNLAYLAAEEGKRVLLWDLDPQGSATYYFEGNPKIKGGIKKLLLQETSIWQHVQDTGYENLSLLPADFGNRHLDSLLMEMKPFKRRFKAVINSWQDDFDYLFLDCVPGIGALSEAIFAAADLVLMPTIPTMLSLRTWEMTNDFFEKNKIDTQKLKGYFSMADVRKAMHNEAMEQFYRNKQFFKNYIPNLSAVEKMGQELAPVPIFAPGSYADQCFRDLWKELKKHTK